MQQIVRWTFDPRGCQLTKNRALMGPAKSRGSANAWSSIDSLHGHDRKSYRPSKQSRTTWQGGPCSASSMSPPAPTLRPLRKRCRGPNRESQRLKPRCNQSIYGRTKVRPCPKADLRRGCLKLRKHNPLLILVLALPVRVTHLAHLIRLEEQNLTQPLVGVDPRR